MVDTMHLLKSHLLNLTPFFNAVVIYFAFVRNPHGDLFTTVLKCLPIVMLMLYIVTKGFGLSKDYKCSQRILLGLIFSCCGDALLNIDLFPHGMASFGVGHIWYISAFGWRPLKPAIGIVLYIFGAAGVAMVFKSLDAVLAVGLPVYAALLLTTCWRSIARAALHKSFINVFCAFGAVLFLISDSIIGIDMFLIRLPYARILIMTTYYIAQFAITLSTANECPAAKDRSGNGKSARDKDARPRGRRLKSKD